MFRIQNFVECLNKGKLKLCFQISSFIGFPCDSSFPLRQD